MITSHGGNTRQLLSTVCYKMNLFTWAAILFISYDTCQLVLYINICNGSFQTKCNKVTKDYNTHIGYQVIGIEEGD